MFSSINQVISRRNFAVSKSLRRFSLISIHNRFPATLYRLQRQPSSRLFNYETQTDEDIEDGVVVSKDGMVYPYISNDIPFSNGALLMPNTFAMQEWMRRCFDSYIEESEDDQLSNLMVLRIPKGTLIPTSLVLFREYSARFSIQPSFPTPLKTLNDTLSDFYSRYAITTRAEEWLDNNEYHMAIADDATEDWMSQ